MISVYEYTNYYQQSKIELSDTNYCRYEGACVADGQLHALVEYINGGSLEDLISPSNSENDLSQDCVDRGLPSPLGNFSATKTNPNENNQMYPELPWSTRISLAQDISNGISYLHSQGIFHRDLTSKVNRIVRKKAKTKG